MGLDWDAHTYPVKKHLALHNNWSSQRHFNITPLSLSHTLSLSLNLSTLLHLTPARILFAWHEHKPFNPLTPNDPYSGRTAPLTSQRCILYIYSTNIGTEYLKHDIYSPYFPLQNAVCFIILTYLVPVLLLNILNTVYTLCFFLFKMQFVSLF